MAEELAAQFADSSSTAADLNQLMLLMMKAGLERMLNTEMDVHLGRKGAPPEGAQAKLEGPPNRRSGSSKKTAQGELGELTLQTPRDRAGTFEPVIVGKHQRRIPDFDAKILALYAKGMTTRDIQEIVQELYGVEVSAQLVSEVTADLDAEVTAWRHRPLSPVWPIVYFDGLVVNVRGENRRVSQHTMYVALGVNLQGKKELLGLGLAQSEGAKFWLGCLSVIRKFTKSRETYPSEESAVKLVYLAIHEASRRWTMPIHHWKQALKHFAILYEDRLPQSRLAAVEVFDACTAGGIPKSQAAATGCGPPD